MQIVNEIACFLHRWQDLAGAIIGGLLGVIGALVVARRLASAEIKGAAIQATIELEGVVAVAKRYVDQSNAGEDQSILAARVAGTPLSELSPLFAQAKHRLNMLANHLLSEHLAIFELNYSELLKQLRAYSSGTPMGVEARRALSENIGRELRKAGYNAVCIQYLLNKKVLKHKFKKNAQLESSIKTTIGEIE